MWNEVPFYEFESYNTGCVRLSIVLAIDPSVDCRLCVVFVSALWFVSVLLITII